MNKDKTAHKNNNLFQELVFLKKSEDELSKIKLREGISLYQANPKRGLHILQSVIKVCEKID
ncbi:hypothetical protein [Nostoc sp.]|uniref:hypothetical protein n=1 Tax=Nostoc sp. TaxID=1180 RepID=UPI002FFB7AC2